MEPSPRRGWTSDIGPFLTMGAQLALAVLVCGLLGRWLDSELGTAPWLMIGGLALGVLGGFIKFIRTAMALGRRADDEAEHLRSSKREE